jgi:hypothetical protein
LEIIEAMQLVERACFVIGNIHQHGLCHTIAKNVWKIFAEVQKSDQRVRVDQLVLEVCKNGSTPPAKEDSYANDEEVCVSFSFLYF